MAFIVCTGTIAGRRDGAIDQQLVSLVLNFITIIVIARDCASAEMKI